GPLAGEDQVVVAGRGHRRGGHGVVVGQRLEAHVVGWDRHVVGDDRGAVGVNPGHRVGLPEVVGRVRLGVDRAGVVQEGSAVLDVVLEAELELDVILGVADVIDVDFVQHGGRPGIEVGAAAGYFDGNVVGDERHR